MPSNSEEDTSVLDPGAKLKKLTDVGSAVTVDNSVPVVRYLRSGPQMEKMARTYYAEGQLEQAFILYNKFATLFVEKLPKHPGYAKAPATDRQRIKVLLKPAFERAMELKEKLKVKYEQERKVYMQQMEEKKKNSQVQPVQGRKSQQPVPLATPSPLQPPPSEKIPPSKEQPSSEELPPHSAQVSIDPQSSDNSPPKTQMPLNEVEKTKPPQIEVQNYEEDDPEDSYTPCDDVLLLSNVQTFFDDDDEYENTGGEGEGRAGLTATDGNLSKVLPDDPAPLAPSTPSTLNLKQPVSQPAHVYTSSSSPNPQTNLTQQSPPVVNPQTYGYPPPDPYSYSPNPPPPYSPYHYQQQPPPPSSSMNQQQVAWQSHETYTRSSSFPLIQQQSSAEVHVPAGTPPVTSTGYPTVDRSTKPQDIDLKPHVLTSLGGLEGGIRPIILPNDISSRFLTLASSNTRKNIETCGILGGRLIQNKFEVSHIIVPKQTGKSDSCETVNEEEIFGVQDKYDLITLGWIHTHPSQTSFMSSVDLHTHCSYQLMLEEAIAIVCAPKYSQVGVFTLTQPHGLNYISKCSGKGFHTHPKEPPLYEDCSHVKYNGSASIQIIDLR